MLAATDVTAIVTVIGASAAAIVSIIVALRQTETKAVVHQIAEQVTPSNGETLTAIVEGNDLRHLDPADPPPPSVTEGAT